MSDHKLPLKRYYGKFLIAALALIADALLAQSPAPTPHSDRAELSKVEEWVLSQGTQESIAAELAAILGLGSDRLPVKLKSYRTSGGINLACAVSSSPAPKGIVFSALRTMEDTKMQVYSVDNAWLTDRSGTLRRTIAVDASGAQVVPNNSRSAEFKDIKAFFLKKLNAAAPTTKSSPSPSRAATASAGKQGTA